MPMTVVYGGLQAVQPSGGDSLLVACESISLIMVIFGQKQICCFRHQDYIPCDIYAWIGSIKAQINNDFDTRYW